MSASIRFDNDEGILNNIDIYVDLIDSDSNYLESIEIVAGESTVAPTQPAANNSEKVLFASTLTGKPNDFEKTELSVKDFAHKPSTEKGFYLFVSIVYQSGGVEHKETRTLWLKPAAEVTKQELPGPGMQSSSF